MDDIVIDRYDFIDAFGDGVLRRQGIIDQQTGTASEFRDQFTLSVLVCCTAHDIASAVNDHNHTILNGGPFVFYPFTLDSIDFALLEGA